MRCTRGSHFDPFRSGEVDSDWLAWRVRAWHQPWSAKTENFVQPKGEKNTNFFSFDSIRHTSKRHKSKRNEHKSSWTKRSESWPWWITITDTRMVEVVEDLVVACAALVTIVCCPILARKGYKMFRMVYWLCFVGNEPGHQVLILQICGGYVAGEMTWMAKIFFIISHLNRSMMSTWLWSRSKVYWHMCLCRPAIVQKAAKYGESTSIVSRSSTFSNFIFV